MPLLVEGSQRSVGDRLSTPSTLGQHSVCVTMVTVRLALLLTVTHGGRELGEATKALEMLWVPTLVHGFDTIRCDEVLALGTPRHEVLLVVLVTVQSILLGVDGNIAEVDLADTADEVMLMVILVLRLHGSVSDCLLAARTGHHIP